MKQLPSREEEQVAPVPAPDGREDPSSIGRRLPFFRKRRRRFQWPRLTIDLSQRKHRQYMFVGFVGVAIATSFLLFSGYKSYTYSESAEFCGTACHPMDPQFVRYEESPHANVDCVACHIGPGASFFVKSKIDGVRQVYAVMVNHFSRPIRSPVHDLRPARETCENCHTPTSFKDNIIKTINHYDNDAENTLVQSTLILKMGGWEEKTGSSQGIHWHINNPVYYIAADEQRQVILWVGVEREDGTMKEYFSRDMLLIAQSSFVEDAWANGEVREMDCIDCHNRTAHEIPPPERLVDESITAGLISTELPFIRAKAVEILNTDYDNLSEAHEAIDGLTDFYQVSIPERYEALRPKIIAAQAQLKQIYTTTNFPDMGLNWETNPNNQRHTPSLGCFRCHDGKHVSVDEAGNELEAVSVKCNNCHTVPIVGRGKNLLIEAPVIVGQVPPSHSDFRWTIEHRGISEEDKEACYQCHGQGFCANEACHNLSHPPDMLYTHAEEYRKRGNQVCYTCHQNVLCSRCHPGGIVTNP